MTEPGTSKRPAGGLIYRRILFVPFFFLAALLASPGAFAAEADPVRNALSARHVTVSVADLERMAGSELALVRRLLELRFEPMPPYLALRAEKMLLSYAALEDVLLALEEGIAAPDRRGLAQIIAMHIDRIPTETGRARIAEAMMRRAAKDESYRSYARMLAESKDPVIRHIYTKSSSLSAQ